MKNRERDRATASGHSEPLASKLKLLPRAIAATAATDHTRAVSEGLLAVRKTATGPTETTRENTGKTLAVRKPPKLTQRPHKGKKLTRRSMLTASRPLNRERQAKRQSEQQDRQRKPLDQKLAQGTSLPLKPKIGRPGRKNGVLRKLKHIFPNTYQRIKSICSPAKGGTGCYRFNHQPGS